MKSCPTCNRTYPDDTLAFCLVDGSILSAPYDSAATTPSPAARDTNPPATLVKPGGSFDSLPATQPGPHDLQSTIVAPFQPPQPFPLQAHYSAQPAEYLQYRSDDEPRKSSVAKKVAIVLGVFGFLIVVAFSLLLIFGPHPSKIQNTMPRTANTGASKDAGALTLDKDEARTREQLRTDPDNAELNRHLAEVLMHEGNIGYEQYARRAVGLNPNSSAMHYTLAEVLMYQNKKAESEAEKKVADRLAGKGK